MTSGIYIISAPSGGQYIGSAVNISERWYRHRNMLRTNTHHNLALQRAANKYGLSNLKCSILLICSKSDLIMFEQRAIDIINPRYNTCRIAGSPLGTIHSEESKLKISIAKKGQGLGVSRPEISQRMLGNTFMVGKIHSEETKNKISSALIGRPKSPEHRRALLAANIGKKLSPEEIAKRQATRRANAEARGYWLSKESIAKREATRKARRLQADLK